MIACCVFHFSWELFYFLNFFIQDMCCPLTFCLHLMEPNWKHLSKTTFENVLKCLHEGDLFTWAQLIVRQRRFKANCQDTKHVLWCPHPKLLTRKKHQPKWIMLVVGVLEAMQCFFVKKMENKGGRIAQWMVYFLLAQRPQVWFSAFTRFSLSENSWCRRDLSTVRTA